MDDNQLHPNQTDGPQDSAEDQPVPEDFESALAELESLVTRMESGEMDLESSLRAYQRGVQLAKVCQTRLQHVEQQVLVLQDELLSPLQHDSEQDAGE